MRKGKLIRAKTDSSVYLS